mmetsp:Transcript_74045/g.120212  ORF Transcript_74045/g.120212 Transcript_74045/m.120212 type:complete len:397 (+) Transcript_74045:73-1263(+)
MSGARVRTVETPARRSPAYATRQVSAARARSTAHRHEAPPTAKGRRRYWWSTSMLGGIVLLGTLEGAMSVPSSPRQTIAARGLLQLAGSPLIDEYCARVWPQNVLSFADSSQHDQTLQGEELQDIKRRLCWYVSFADFFHLFKTDQHSPVVKEKAVELMKQALASHAASDSKGHHTSEGLAGASGRKFELPFILRPWRRRGQKSDTAERTLKIKAETPEIEFSWIEAPKSRGLALVCIAPREKLAVVAVRGSVNVHNFISALKVWPKKGADVGVSLHSGFSKVADEMMEKIEPLLAKDMTIHLTGHSLGGAVSTILALRLKRKGYDISQVVAFGMPLVVWQGAAQGDMAELALDIPLLRVEHPLDPIPHFPGAVRAPRRKRGSVESEGNVGRGRSM